MKEQRERKKGRKREIAAGQKSEKTGRKSFGAKNQPVMNRKKRQIRGRTGNIKEVSERTRLWC